MIYIKDEATGVTVEDGDYNRVNVHRFGENGSSDFLDPAEADSLLVGLLRWKLVNSPVLREGDIDILKRALRIVERYR